MQGLVRVEISSEAELRNGQDQVKRAEPHG
jgi:hypothetical protein